MPSPRRDSSNDHSPPDWTGAPDSVDAAAIGSAGNASHDDIFSQGRVSGGPGPVQAVAAAPVATAAISVGDRQRSRSARYPGSRCPVRPQKRRGGQSPQRRGNLVVRSDSHRGSRRLSRSPDRSSTEEFAAHADRSNRNRLSRSPKRRRIIRVDIMGTRGDANRNDAAAIGTTGNALNDDIFSQSWRHGAADSVPAVAAAPVATAIIPGGTATSHGIDREGTVGGIGGDRDRDVNDELRWSMLPSSSDSFDVSISCFCCCCCCCFRTLKQT